jgi:UDP-N-acetylglucosamine--N-acetylmuramyl-(pentapeptide) pyrophosphoryl-undecaprenol N-acetylglucosamine transferase
MGTVLIAGGGTGGHLMPALSIAAALDASDAGLEPVLVGAVRGVEARLLPTRDFRYHLLPSEPIYRRTWWKNLRWPAIAGRLLRQVEQLFAEERPVAVLGTGGYASGPVVWWATRRGVPAAIQEQNAYPGLASRLLSRRVGHVYLGLPEARRLLRFGRATRVFDTGNPITPPTPERRTDALRLFGLSGSRPVLLVTGGSQGALAINQAVAGWIDAGGAGAMDVLWVTGRGTHEQFARYHRPPAVTVIDFLDPMADGYAVADLVISRAGMITVAELCAWGLPSILIPLPTAAADHQTHNAKVLAEAGASQMVRQDRLDPAMLGNAIGALMADPAALATMAQRARARGRPHAAAEIVSHLLTLVRQPGL